MYQEVSASKFLFVDGQSSDDEMSLRTGDDHKMTSELRQGRDKINNF